MVPRAARKTRDATLAESLDFVTRERQVLVFRSGKSHRPIAALVPIESEKELEALEDDIDVREAARNVADMKRKGEKPVPTEKVRKELGLD